MIPELEVKGAPFQRGEQIGCRFKTQIRSTLARLSENREVRDRQITLMEAMLGHLEAEFPEILEEIRGIARGAEISDDDAFFKNTYNAVGPALADDLACSSVAFVASDVGPILGKTDDGSFRPGSDRLGGLTILTIRSEEGYDVLCVNQIGTVWTECGVNEKGLCIGTNSGHPTMKGQDGIGVPQHIVPRLLLRRCANVKEGIDFLRRTTLTGKGINIVLADAEGSAAATENACAMNGVREPEHGVVFSTNHYFSEEMQAVAWRWDPEFIRTRYFQNSLNRIAHLYGRFGDGRKALSLQEMREVLMDEHNPGGLCQRPQNNENKMTTNFGVILVCRDREMWLNEGPPSLNRFDRYALS
jgi:predicted choloylglycine hydrolase